MKKALVCTVYVILILATAISAKAFDGESYKTYDEFPLMGTDSIVVDFDENIYLNNQSSLFSRTVQIYDSKGNFKHSIKVNTEGGFYLGLSSDNMLEVVLLRGEVVYVFDKQGYVLEKYPIKPTDIANAYQKDSSLFRTINGDVYRIKSFFGYITVQKESSGMVKTVYAMKPGHWIIKFLIIMLYVVVLSGGLYILIKMMIISMRDNNKKKLIKPFKFKKYYFAMHFKLKANGTRLIDSTYIEDGYKNKELLRNIILWSLLLLLLVNNIIYFYQTGGFFDRGIELVVRIIFISMIFTAIDLLVLILRYNLSKFTVADKQQ